MSVARGVQGVVVDPGVVEYFDRGTGPVIVFAHGWMANANLWRKVVDALAATHRCITLDLPLGAHRRPVAADAALDAGACGELIAEALEVLDVDEVTLVGNDSGGAYSQIATSRHPERVARLVLNSCAAGRELRTSRVVRVVCRGSNVPSVARVSLRRGATQRVGDTREGRV